MFKSEMEKAVQGILYTARDIWNRIGCMDDVVNLVRSAKMICAMYDLEMLEDVQNFENVMVKEWKEYKADEAEKELKKRFYVGFTEEQEETAYSGNYCVNNGNCLLKMVAGETTSKAHNGKKY